MESCLKPLAYRVILGNKPVDVDPAHCLTLIVAFSTLQRLVMQLRWLEVNLWNV